MNMLSGSELVEKGTTKTDATLPELGLKDVAPNGTCLEKTQIEAAIEARKKLIEVERIEKAGSLSYAEWKEELMLAEVTKKVGGHWQYLGHNVGKKLFIKPEEALFLMELNCLHLEHNNVQVSLQQAYSLLLGHKISHQQYKVYSSLSRIGYRVYRHETSPKEINTDNNEAAGSSSSYIKTEIIENSDVIGDEIKAERRDVDDNIQIKQEPIAEENITDEHNAEVEDIPVNNEDAQTNIDTEMKSTSDSNRSDEQSNSKNSCCKMKLQSLKNRKLKPCNSKIVQNYFNNLPELTGTSTVIIKKPNSVYIPGSINLSKEEFTIDLQNVRDKTDRTDASDTNIYNVGDEVNGSHIRRLSDASNNRFANNPASYNNYRSHNTQYRPYNMWRDRHSFNYFNVNMLFRRQFTPPWYPNAQCQFTPRNHAYPRPSLSINNLNIPQSRKRPKNSTQSQHLDGIKRLSAKLKLLLLKGNMNPKNKQSLQRLVQLYNRRYKTRIRVSPELEILDENVLDTIELDDDEPAAKRQKRDEDKRAFKDNIEHLKQLASKLKDLENNNQSTGRHRRAMSKLLKIFNETYQEQYSLTDDYEIKNPRQIVLDTSESESDCCVTEDVQSVRRGKKLKNPFNILKRLSEKQKETNADASTSSDSEMRECKMYSDVVAKTFSKAWLPSENDFGRAEVVDKDCASEACIHGEADMRREEFMYDFLKIQSTKSDNWLNLKISFYQSFNEAMAEFQGNVTASTQVGANTAVRSEDNSMASVLKKLSIIKSDNSINEECKLKIDFDVYNRDVQNFRKSNRPTPHFRLIVLDQSSNVPSGEEIATLKSKYEDDVTIIFAIVAMNTISYIQIKPTSLPVYLHSTDV